MSKRMELIGQRFGKLTVLKFAYIKSGNSFWICQCDCENTITTQGSSLKSGHTLSCGCYQKTAASIAKKTHGMTKTRLYRIYRHMKERCYSPSCRYYADYGGRRIHICNEWLDDFMNFYSWAINNGYSENLSIDRIDNNKGYFPNNCRWVTAQVQCNNRRSNIYLEYLGESKTLADWARMLGIKYSSLVGRWDKGIKAPEIFQNISREDGYCASM